MSVNIASEEFRLNVNKMIAKRVSSQEDVDDITQDVFMKIIRYADTDQPESFYSWLKFAVKSSIGEYYRKNSIYHSEFDEETALPPINEKSWVDDLKFCINPFLAKLDKDEAKLIQNVDLEEISQKDYALENDINYSTLKSKLQKARKSLLKEVSECCTPYDISCSKNC